MNFYIVFLLNLISLSLADYYGILGVSRSATDAEIKKAYKKLAREWHPDKSRHKDASEKFMTINEAYEVLSNTEKRREFDAFGHVSNEGPPQHQQFHPFFFHGHGGSGGGEENVDVEWASYRTLVVDLEPASEREPVLLLAVSPMCFFCGRALRLWAQMKRSGVGDAGIRLVAVDVGRDGRMQERVRVYAVPKAVLLLDREMRYMQTDLSEEAVIMLVRDSMPAGLVTEIRSLQELSQFCAGWRLDSRPRMLLVKPLDRPPLRYLNIAFRHRRTVVAGFINVDKLFRSSDAGFRALREAWDLHDDVETWFLFHDKSRPGEDLPVPVTSLRSPKVQLDAMESALVQDDNGPWLPLPRITSQETLNRLCPPEGSRICALYLASRTTFPDRLEHWDLLRRQAASAVGPTPLRFGFIFVESQMSFLTALLQPHNYDLSSLVDSLLLLHRTGSQSALSLLLPPISWTSSLHSLPQPHQESSDLPPLVDELEAALVWRLMTRMRLYGIWAWRLLADAVTEDPYALLLLAMAAFMTYYLLCGLAARIVSRPQSSRPSRGQQDSPSYSPSLPHNILKTSRFTMTEEKYQRLLVGCRESGGRLVSLLLCTAHTPPDTFTRFLECFSRLKCDRVEPLLLPVDCHPRWLSAILQQGGSGLVSGVSRVSVQRPHATEGCVLVMHPARHWISVAPLNMLLPEDGETPDNEDDMFPCQATPSLFDWLGQLLDGGCDKFKVHHWPPSLSR